MNSRSKTLRKNTLAQAYEEFHPSSCMFSVHMTMRN